MSLSDDDFDLSESDVFLQDYLALLREVVGPISGEIRSGEIVNNGGGLALLRGPS
jgi:hypothetical protein